MGMGMMGYKDQGHRTYNLLTHPAIPRNLLTLRAAELLGACVEGFVEVILASCACSCAGVGVGVVHFCIVAFFYSKMGGGCGCAAGRARLLCSCSV